jgi:hypothetical protein
VHAGALTVAVGALQLSDRHAFVFVAEGDVVHRRAIRTGVDGGEWLEVVEGLVAGEQVVTAGIDTLADGMKIRAAAPPKDATGTKTGTKTGETTGARASAPAER